MNKIFKFISKREKSFFVIAGVIFVVIIYLVYKNFNQPKATISYTTVPVEKGMLISTITGSGQVLALNQIDIKPKVTGDITEVAVSNAEEVKEGDIIAKIDRLAAQKKVRDAGIDLETAKLELDELLSPPDELTLLLAENTVLEAREKLDELLGPVDEFDLFQAENNLVDAQDSLTKLKLDQKILGQQAEEDLVSSKDDLEKAYEDAFNTIADVFLELPTVVTALDNILYSDEIADSEPIYLGQINNLALSTAVNKNSEFLSFLINAKDDYDLARDKYDENFANYINTSRYADKDEIEALLAETLETEKAVSTAVKSHTNMIDNWVDYRSRNSLRVISRVAIYQNNLKSYTSTINSDLSAILSIQRNIEDAKESKLDAERDIAKMDQNQPLELAAAQRNVAEKKDSLAELKAGADEAEIESSRRDLAEKELSLAKLKAGADDLDIRAKQIDIQKKQDALLDAREELSDHTITAPLDGVVAKINVIKGDSVSPSTVIATLITQQMIAEIILNEIDVAQVAAGQKVTLQFDAVEDLVLTGEVMEVDAMGAVNQGIVSYGVKIAFDVQDARIKSGMSTSVNIIVASKRDIMIVPISAVKMQGESSYVEVLVAGISERRTVTTDLSNDIMIEITGGLEVGDEVVTQSIGANNSYINPQSSGGNSRGSMQGVFRMIH